MQTLAKLKASIADIRKDTKSIRGRVQTVVRHATGHALIDGSVEAYNMLYSATKGANRKSLQKWIETYGFAKLTKEGKFKLNKKARREYFASIDKTLQNISSTDADAYIATLDANWWEDPAKAPKEPTAIIVADKVERINKMVQDALESGREVQYDVDALTAALEALQNTLKLVNAADPEPMLNTQYKPHAVVNNSQSPMAIAAE